MVIVVFSTWEIGICLAGVLTEDLTLSVSQDKDLEALPWVAECAAVQFLLGAFRK